MCHPDLGRGQVVITQKENDMSKKQPPNAGKPWSAAQDAQLRREAKGNTPTRVIGLHMGRTEDAIRSHASNIGVSLKPTNQSPYGTKKR